MPIALDHMILQINDRDESLRFYTEVLGFEYDGERAPFTTVRVDPNFVILLAPFGTTGGEHLAFSMSRDEFETLFQRIKDHGIEYGDRFDQSANMQGPGKAEGARGDTVSLYCMDPSKHLIELVCYE